MNFISATEAKKLTENSVQVKDCYTKNPPRRYLKRIHKLIIREAKKGETYLCVRVMFAQPERMDRLVSYLKNRGYMQTTWWKSGPGKKLNIQW